MKSFILIISSCYLCSIHGQNDSETSKGFMIEFGHSRSMFYNQLSDNKVNNRRFTYLYNHKHNLSNIKLAYSNNNFIYFLNCQEYNSPRPILDNNKQVSYNVGQVSSRWAVVLNSGIGYEWGIEKIALSVEPSIFLSARPFGMETVIIGEHHFHSGDYYTIRYEYKSIGFGAGVNLKKSLYKNLFVSFDTRFNYFFEKNNAHIRNKMEEDFNMKYKVNRSMWTLSLNIGYRFKI